MKKILTIVIIGLFVLYGFGAVALHNDAKQINNNQEGKRVFTHTVFSEFASTSTCSHCPYVHMALKNIYYGGWYPFYYISLALGKNTHANARATEYNVYYVPDTFFDGGYQVYCGSMNDNTQQTMNQFNSSITLCGDRSVPDIFTTLSVNWLGNATMDIQVSVQNNDSIKYNGRIRVYITEVESTMGWKDAQNNPYTFAFLDYAFNETISINSGDTWTDSITWDGHNYNDGQGHNFGNIQIGNIMVIAAVFNSQGYTAYSDAPYSYQHPFTAYYVDDATGFFVGGPNTPSNPNPANGTSDVDLNKDLSWTGGPGSSISYDVYFGTDSNPPLAVSNQSSTTYDQGTMEYETTYYWRIVAWDSQGYYTEGPIWYFTTIINPNDAPTAPIITGPTTGKEGTVIEYNFVSTDPDQDKLYYYVSWGDGTYSGWIGPYNPGEQVYINHTWSKKGTYKITARANDEHGALSTYSTQEVKIPRLKALNNPLLLKILERLLYYFPVFKHILRM